MRIVDHDFTIGKLPVSFSNPLAFERKAMENLFGIVDWERGEVSGDAAEGPRTESKYGTKKDFRVKSDHFYTS